MNFLLFGNPERKLNDLSLDELGNEVYKIKKEQNYITSLGLSAEVTSLAVKELQEQKEELLELMHKRVNEL